MASDSDEEMRVKAYQIVARAEGDEAFSKRVKADPAAVLKEFGLSADLVKKAPENEQALLPGRWGCNDFTCWSSACPGTCYVTYCHTTYLRD